MAVIYITKQDGTRSKFRLPTSSDTVVTIGRDEENLVALPDVAGISGRHCVITYAHGGYAITDAGSTNGTMVQGRRIVSEPLTEGLVYKLGDADLSYDAERDSATKAQERLQKSHAAPTAVPTERPVATHSRVKFAPHKKEAPVAAPVHTRLRGLYIVVIFILSFAAGLTLRHLQNAGLISLWVEGAPAEAPAEGSGS